NSLRLVRSVSPSQIRRIERMGVRPEIRVSRHEILDLASRSGAFSLSGRNKGASDGVGSWSADWSTILPGQLSCLRRADAYQPDRASTSTSRAHGPAVHRHRDQERLRYGRN